MNYSSNCQAIQALEFSLEAIHASQGLDSAEDPVFYINEAILTLRISSAVLVEAAKDHDDAERSWRFATVAERLNEAANRAQNRLNDGLHAAEYYAGQTLLSVIPTLRFGLDS